MNDLRALVKVVSQQKVKQIEIISEQAKLSTKAKLLYDGLKAGEIKTDEEAVLVLYDQKYIDSKYRKLKSRLRNRLVNTLFFIDVQQYSRFEVDKALVKAHNLVSAVYILRNKGQLAAAMDIAEDAFKITKKFDLLDLSLSLSLLLSNYYSAYKSDKTKYELYSKMVSKYQKLLNLEIAARNCFNYFALLINNKKNSKILEHSDQIKTDLILIKENIHKYDAYNFKFYAFNVLYFESYLNKNYSELEQVSEQAVLYFKSKNGFSTLGEFSFTQKLGIAYQALGKFNDAIKVYKEALGLNPREGGLAWYNIRNHLFNTHLATLEYQNAYKYLLEATLHKSFKNLFETHREPWLVKEAYVHLLINIGKVVEDSEVEIKLRPFRINRFLNEVPHFSKDKRGLNIAILIIHVLFLFINKKEFEIEDRLNALGQYSFRYLRNDETLRSNAFIKMLQKLPLANFHPVRLKRHVEKFHKRLLETPMNISEQSAEIEIIPYEHLWEIVIELLQMRLEKKI